MGITTKFEIDDIVMIKQDVDRGLLVNYKIVGVDDIYISRVTNHVTVVYKLETTDLVDGITQKKVAGYNLYYPHEIKDVLKDIVDAKLKAWELAPAINNQIEGYEIY
jgi:hypothetical protein